jgi:hypothetical protein
MYAPMLGNQMLSDDFKTLAAMEFESGKIVVEWGEGQHQGRVHEFALDES